ncbi:uncharacterized protein LOC119662992 isoform X1 [Teleopsis dalmanni]|uniref:uncharacterized protein LOC119662992 isoform X1 n=1 Tax=Teleopsis dalmanni TaxID=139649 RepID=UPI0018CD2419|nr:uncharacterized protein LOC119662992 isoform X1 [Teleopsis dalmanni]
MLATVKCSLYTIVVGILSIRISAYETSVPVMHATKILTDLPHTNIFNKPPSTISHDTISNTHIQSQWLSSTTKTSESLDNAQKPYSPLESSKVMDAHNDYHNIQDTSTNNYSAIFSEAIPAVELPPNALITIPKQVVPVWTENITRVGRKRNYKYIPLSADVSNNVILTGLKYKRNNSLNFQSAIESNENLNSELTERSDKIITSDRIDFSGDNLSKRIDFHSPSYSLKSASSFQPESYREDNPILSEIPIYENPYNDDFSSMPSNKETRNTRQLIFETDPSHISHNIEFPGKSVNTKPHTLNSANGGAKIFYEDVTKFGDVNGPITALPQHSKRINFFGEAEILGGPPRQFVPTKALNEFVGLNNFQNVRKSRYFPFKSSRSPRVIFPTNDNASPTGSGSASGPGTGIGVYFNDNVAFRDQNFGLNELAAIQDVRNEFNLKDLDSATETSTPHSANTFKEKVDITTELQCQHRGGTCEFFLTCWMSGGLLQGTCDGLLRGCCHRTAKSINLLTSDYVGDTIDLTDLPLKNYGPIKNDASCGISLAKQTAQRRIVGGDDAGFGSFPWQAYIRIGSSRCGGSLVSRRHVVTAGHCVARAISRQVHVTLGDYVINSAVEPLPAYTFGVRRIDVHPYFKFTPQADRFDVSVLTLERPVHFMPHIAPICLPEKNEDFLGKFGWAAGWGALNPGSRLRPKTLQAVDVPVIENRICERWHRQNGINVVIYPEMMCAGYRNGGKDSCQGDSGGPLMNEKNGRWYLIGVVSAGYSCASRGQPGIYHRVPFTVDWISYVVGLTANL